jgi:hypothetical protein
MDAKTKRAFQASRRHHWRMAKRQRRLMKTRRKSNDLALEIPGAGCCALCRLYLYKFRECNGCPVAKYTGKPRCNGTPYGKEFDAYVVHGPDSDEFAAAARKMAEWLDRVYEEMT